MSERNVGEVLDLVQDVADFHEKFGLKYDGLPRSLPEKLGEFRRKFLDEEAREYRDAKDQVDYWLPLLKSASESHRVMARERVPAGLEGMLDALVDLVYVAIGNAYMHGFDFREAWRRVHEANMRKIRATAETASARGGTSDVVKPPGWAAPSHADLVADHAHKEKP